TVAGSGLRMMPTFPLSPLSSVRRVFPSKMLPTTFYWKNRHRGGGHPPTPATPPCVRVRTRRFELVTLALINQGRKSERVEVSIRKPHRESFGSGERPRATPAAGRVACQTRENPEL